jgi:hypothetical protein
MAGQKQWDETHHLVRVIDCWISHRVASISRPEDSISSEGQPSPRIAPFHREVVRF